MQPSLPYSEEDAALLLLLQRHRFPSNAARLRTLLGGTLDWPVLLAQARLHSVLPLLTAQLQRLGYWQVPATVVAELQRRTRTRSIHNMLLVQELRRILRQLMAAGIAVLPLKGMALAEALYGDCMLRDCADIDIVVPKAQIPPVVHLLEAQGYRAQGPWEWWTTSPIHFEIALLRTPDGLRYDVDLHWGLLGGDPRHACAMEALWAACHPATVLGVDAWAMSPEWTLLALILHAARSQWQGLKWLVDIQEICWAWTLDWPTVWALARQWGWEEIVQLTIDTCQTLWELPPALSADSHPPPTWLPRFPTPPRPRQRVKLRILCLLFPQWRVRLIYVLRLLSTPTSGDYWWRPLPVALFPLYIVLRPLRLVVGWTQAGLRTLWRWRPA